ncbi:MULTISPECIES: D-amino-acid transaminase [unclassified Mesorhizobium]|uniref:D-amino-acid transaminase n=1 Tax=unclassified Mesorhizobium TaxID=325217 RepID=UPI00112BA8CF|nr:MULTISPECIES: D-amino-acid transaminase [unclassified Mesorhizobium]TPJ40207.1 D-amino-acid transaminase [Mesorhizobium sp. B2-6-6]MBZ9917125.1 D-amino-acid transaminase [Mesorhizobium sp. BR1-1-7]MBZ9972102.1 D-amino-acid transaminase [Mesorhizobium sp. BR1-1-12]MBZ9984659.1 D-amino-acid transaminase [Mesorhizobium sp. BR-1-1-8]MCA0002499.1 D-amino-acid transaminase [Mesorhizobium sp. B264B2A]
MAKVAQVYCNRRYMPEDEARIGLFDRGFLFADAVYEVTAVMGGRLIDNDFHLNRLQRSLAEICIPMPVTLPEIEAIQLELISLNGLDEGTVYLQISRGEAKRNFLFPDDLEPTMVAFTSARKLVGTKAQAEGVAVDLAPDPRWARRDIKTVMLLGQVLAKHAASEKGFDDVWFVEGGQVTEGASATAFIVTHDGRVITRANSQAILPGCTRRAVARLCEDQGILFEERAFSPEEAFSAAEAFLTSASSLVTPVIRIAGHRIGNGQPGPLTRRLQEIYVQTAFAEMNGHAAGRAALA